MKYTISRTDGTPIPEDEPCFVIRAKDQFALIMLRYYRDLTWGIAPASLTRDMDEHLNRMTEWRKKNRHLIKVPD